MTAPAPEFRSLSKSDAAALRGFRCADVGSWADEIQTAIRTEIADRLIDGRSNAEGAFIDGTLAGLSTWVVEGTTWYSSIIAVLPEFRRRRIATELKRRLLMQARAGGALTVDSTVAWGNDAMQLLNRQLGAEIVPVTNVWGRVEYLRAIFKVN